MTPSSLAASFWLHICRECTLGGYDNVLMPLYAGIAIYFGIGLGLASKSVERQKTLPTVLAAATTLQFAGLFYMPDAQIPTGADKQQGEALSERLASFAGNVYMPEHPWYLGRLNKPTQAHRMALADILRAPKSAEWKRALEQEMANAIASGIYDAVVMDTKHFNLPLPEFERHYELVASNLSGNAFFPVTGAQFRPNYLYVARSTQRSSSKSVAPRDEPDPRRRDRASLPLAAAERAAAQADDLTVPGRMRTFPSKSIPRR